MTTHFDILGRPPKRIETFEHVESSEDDDWRGERFLKVPRNPSGGGRFNMRIKNKAEKAKMLEKRRHEIRRLAALGFTVPQMAQETGIATHIIQQDVARCGIDVVKADGSTPRPTCRVCGIVIAKRSTSGVCKTHLHGAACLCRQCCKG
jgi:hypothetical protein